MLFEDLPFALPEEEWLIDIAWTLGTAAVLVAAALAVYALLALLARRIARRTRASGDELLLDHLLRPLRWFAVALALLSLDEFEVPREALAARIVGLVELLMPLLWGWLLIAVIRFLKSYIDLRSDIAAEDNLAARRRRTRPTSSRGSPRSSSCW